MRFHVNVDNVISAATNAATGVARHIIRGYIPLGGDAVSHYNEYCLVLKPDLFERQVNTREAVSLILASLSDAQQEVVAGVAIGAAYLLQHQTMSQHYAIIDRVSRCGIRALAPDARGQVSLLAADELTTILGGHELLRRYSWLTADALNLLCENVPTHRLGFGTSCVDVDIEGRRTIVLNGFHPYQLARYESPGAVIVALAVRSATRWHTIRQAIVGATDPAQAPERSLRHELYARRDTLRLRYMSRDRNGVHCSSGPLEAMLELARFFGEPEPHSNLHATTFARMLSASGANDFGRLQDRPISHCAITYATDVIATENLDSADAARVLTGRWLRLRPTNRV